MRNLFPHQQCFSQHGPANPTVSQTIQQHQALTSSLTALDISSQVTAEVLVSGQIVTVKSLMLTSLYGEAPTGSVCQKSLEEVFPPQAIY